MRDELTAALQARWEESLADEATDGGDGVGEVEEGVDDFLAALVAALQPVEVVVPGVSPLGMPALPGLDRGLVAFWAISPVMPRTASSTRTLPDRSAPMICCAGPAGTAAPFRWGRRSPSTGRSPRPLHLLALADPADDGYRRTVNTQLTVQESRHRLARKIFHGQRDELRQAYREGQDKTNSARSAWCSTP
jgi:hypothetical protein